MARKQTAAPRAERQRSRPAARPFWRRPIAAAALIAALGVATVSGPPAAAQESAQESVQESAQESAQNAPTVAGCAEAVDETALEALLTQAAEAALAKSAAEVDYERVVTASWLAVRFDSRFADIVDEKIALLRADRAYLERLLDGNIPSRAQEMAERTAELVFGSPEFAALQGDLQAEVGRRLAPRLAEVEADSRGVAAACVRTYLGRRFADSVQAAFAAEAADRAVDTAVSLDGVTTGVALSLAGVVAAILTVVFRRMVRRIVRAAVQRLAGAIAARLAAWASVLAGAALLAYELVAGAEGVFPIIRAELTSAATRDQMRAALVSELETEAPARLRERAPAVAREMLGRWRAFQDNHDALLGLAEAEPDLKRYLDAQPPERFDAVSTIVAALRVEGGPERVRAALEDGSLAEAAAIPSFGRQLELWRPKGQSVSNLLAWSRLAGGRFDAALDAGLPGALAPQDTDADELAALLSLGDRSATRKAADLPPDARAEALALPAADLSALARTLTAPELAAVFQTVRPLDDPARRRGYLTRAAGDPRSAAVLARGASAAAVRASRDPGAALELLLDPSPLWNPFAVYDHGSALLSGAVGPRAVLERYGWSLLVLLVPALILFGLARALFGGLAWMLRPLFRRRAPRG